MNDYRSDLKAYLDGELTPERARDVEAAIATDPALREEVEFMKVLGFEIQRIKHDPVVTGASEAIAATRRRPAGFFMRYRWMLGAGLGVLFVFAVFPLYAQSKSAARQTLSMAAAKSASADGERISNGSLQFGAEWKAPATLAPSESGKFSESQPQDSDALAGAMKGRENARATRDQGLQFQDGVRHRASAGDTSLSDAAKSAFPLSQKLIRTADLSMRVASAKTAQSQAIQIVTGAGGFVAASNLSGSKDSAATATVTLRVPVRSFDRTLESLRTLGDVISDTSNTEDVTAQVADTEARLKVMRAEEDSYVTMLRAARRVGELLEIKERLSSVRQEIESLTAQKKALSDQSSYSTITATFEEKPKVGEPEPPKDWSSEVWANAVNGLRDVGRFLASAGIFLFVYAPIWLPILIIGWIAVKRSRKA